MAFDPRQLAPLIGSLGGAGGGGNGFLRGWMRAQQEAEARKAREQQTTLATEDRDLRRQQIASQESRASAADARAEQDQILQTVGTFRNLLGDESIDDPEMFNQRLAFASQFAPKLGVDTGFLESLRPTPTTFQRRKASKLLKDIETDPRIKKLVDSGEDIGGIVYERQDLGPNPDRQDGQPLWSIGEIYRLAQKPTPAQPLPKPAAAEPIPRLDTRSLEARAADAAERGDTEAYNRLIRAAQDMAGARRPPATAQPSQPQTSSAPVDPADRALAELAARTGELPGGTPSLRGRVLRAMASDPALLGQYEQKRMEPIRAQAQIMLTALGDLLTLDGELTTGGRRLFGERLPVILRGAGIEQSQVDANASLRQITGQQVVDLIREMKGQSQTGATGFGQLNIRELDIILSAATRLTQRISEPLAKAELQTLREKFSKMLQPSPNEGSQNAGPRRPQVGDVVRDRTGQRARVTGFTPEGRALLEPIR